MKLTFNFLSINRLYMLFKSQHVKIGVFLLFTLMLSSFTFPDYGIITSVVDSSEGLDSQLRAASGTLLIGHPKYCEGTKNFCSLYMRRLAPRENSVEVKIFTTGLDDSGKFVVQKISFPNLSKEKREKYFSGNKFLIDIIFEAEVIINGRKGRIVIHDKANTLHGQHEPFIIF